MITEEQIARAYETRRVTVKRFYPFIKKWMGLYSIDTPMQQAQFLAQVGHESGRLYYTEEIASGEAYEGRKDLGNTVKGYGKKYKGRGLIQITGYFNYRKLSEDTGIDFVNYPEKLSEMENAVMSACWFWDRKNLNDIASDIVKVTKKINGGMNGFDDRLLLFNRLKYELGI